MDNKELIASSHVMAAQYAHEHMQGTAETINQLCDALEAAETELTRRDTEPGTWACIKCGRGAFEHSAPDLPSGDCVAETHWKQAAAGLSLEAADAQACEEGYQRGVAAMRASADEAHAFEEGMFEVIKHRFSGRGLGTRQAIIDAFAAFLRDPEPAAAPVSVEAGKVETTTEWGVSHMEGHERAYELSPDRESAEAELRSLNQGYGWPGENHLVTREVTEWRPVKPEEVDRG